MAPGGNHADQTLVGRRFVRLKDERGGTHVGVVEGDEIAVLAKDDMLAVLMDTAPVEVVDRAAIVEGGSIQPESPWRLCAPIVAPETWAAGVTYERSRDARTQESQSADVYNLVYEATRPELFLKDAAGRRTVGPGDEIAARTDAAWTVPEPELGLVLGAGGALLGVTIGNDVSSRDIEGANPLYLPQAKVYGRACALGPAILQPADWELPFEIGLRILEPGGEVVFEGRTSTARMRRSLHELVEFLCRDNPVPAGSVLLTGTGIVPPDDLTLAPGQTVEIAIPRIGVLSNPVGV